MNEEDNTMEFDEFVKYQAWVLDLDPDLKEAFGDDLAFDDELGFEDDFDM